MALPAWLSIGHLCPCLGGSSQYIAADMQILWQLVCFRPLSVYSLCLSLYLFLSCGCNRPTSLQRKSSSSSSKAAAAATVGRNARSPEELQWHHNLTSCLLLLLSSPISLLPTHSYFCLHACYPLSMPGRRAQGQSRVEEDGAQLQSDRCGHGHACMEHTG